MRPHIIEIYTDRGANTDIVGHVWGLGGLKKFRSFFKPRAYYFCYWT